MEKILNEIQNEIIAWAWQCSDIGYTTYEDGVYEGLKIAEEIIKKEMGKGE